MKCQSCLRELTNRIEEDRGLCLKCFNESEKEWNEGVKAK